MGYIAGIAALAVSAGSAIYSGVSQSNAQSKQQAAQQQLLASAQANPAGIFGTTPQFTPVDYQPLYQSDPGYANLAADVLKGDIYDAPIAEHLTNQINAATSKDAMSRIQGWDPSFMSSLNLLSQNANSALAGNLPFSDVNQIVGAQGQAQNILGNAGGTGALNAADLGQSKLNLMDQIGPGLLGQVASVTNAVDPVSNQLTAGNLLLSPQQGVQNAIGENEFGAGFNEQQNLQLAALSAMPNPQAQGIFNIQALQAGLSGQLNTGISSSLNSASLSLNNAALLSRLYGSGSNPYGMSGSLYGSSPYSQPIYNQGLYGNMVGNSMLSNGGSGTQYLSGYGGSPSIVSDAGVSTDAMSAADFSAAF